MSEAPLSPEVLAALGGAEAYPDDASAADGIRRVQTHLSHVFLTGARVYKFRKPVDLGFVCFTSGRERNEDCLREVALNRRLAPDVYLGVAPLLVGAAGVRVGPVAETLAPGDPTHEHCVVMRRLPEGRDALSLLERGRLEPEQLDRVSARVAAFHADHGLGVPAPFGPEAWRERCVQPAEDNFRLLAESDEALVPAPLRERAESASRVFVRERAERFEARRVAGRAVDGHGDLHLQHVWFERDESPPLVIDCLEFSERLRRIDAAAEVAFPAMDLRYRGRADLAERFLRVYAAESDDFDLYGVVDYFVAYRAAVRAKVAALAAADPSIGREQREGAAGSARRHLELAARALDPRPTGPLVLVAGGVGTGKTSVAHALADATGGAVVSSDRVRKHRAGVPVAARSGDSWRAGLYDPEQTRRVYEGMRTRARPIARSGRVAILDATFGRRDERQRAAQLADELGAPSLLVEVGCAREVALARLARRQAAGRDASDAGPEIHDPIAAAFEAPEEWPAADRVRIETDRDDWRERVGELARRLGRVA